MACEGGRVSEPSRGSVNELGSQRDCNAPLATDGKDSGGQGVRGLEAAPSVRGQSPAPTTLRPVSFHSQPLSSNVPTKFRPGRYLSSTSSTKSVGDRNTARRTRLQKLAKRSNAEPPSHVPASTDGGSLRPSAGRTEP